MSNPTLTPKEKIESWLNLLKHAAERFDARRNFEWKISLGLWAGLLGVAHFLKDSGTPSIPLWPFLLISAVYGLVWLPGLWQANDNDKNLVNYYRRQVEILVGVDWTGKEMEFPDKNEGLLNRLQAFKDWSIQFQFAVTLGLSLLGWVYLNGKL